MEAETTIPHRAQSPSLARPPLVASPSRLHRLPMPHLRTMACGENEGNRIMATSTNNNRSPEDEWFHEREDASCLLCWHFSCRPKADSLIGEIESCCLLSGNRIDDYVHNCPFARSDTYSHSMEKYTEFVAELHNV